MKYATFLLSALCVVALLGRAYAEDATDTKSAAPATIKTTDGRELKLVWADEFNGEGLPDAEKWSYEVGYVRNNEGLLN